MCTRASKAPSTQHAAQQNRENTKLLVRASFGASLYTTAHEQHEWPPRVSGRAVRESKRKMRKAECMHTQSHFQRNFFKRRQARKKQCTYLSEAFAKQNVDFEIQIILG